MMSTPHGVTQPMGTRGPAPPLPEKPPSVAERTRLLKSSFRHNDVDKPRPVVADSSHTPTRSSPLSEVTRSAGSSVSSLNSNPAVGDKEREESPPSFVNGANTPPVVPSKPPPMVTPPIVNPAMVTPVMDNKEVERQAALSSAKREAFFKNAELTAPTPKFDPNVRFTSERPDRGTERNRDPPIREPVKNMATEDKEKERDRKYGDTTKELEGYVGFANLPNQVYRKSVKRGFDFTLMVVGESGLGKSTLINSLFLTDLYAAEYPGPSHRIQKTVKVDKTNVALKENGVQLRLTVVDTPGFGDAVDNSNCWQPVIDFIDCKYEEYLTNESKVVRSTTADTRVHCCLYFIAPTGHGLKPLDVEFMRRLHDKVNIIPLIAKADTQTPDECREFKKTILNEIAQHKIKIYEFPECDDEEENKIQKKLKDRVPFAVVGSNTVTEAGGKRIRGRQYPWGIVEVENLEHNDFLALRNMLIRTHMQDLKDVTNNVHYENFRYNKLAPANTDGKIKPGSLTKDPLSQMAEEKREHDTKMKKMEAEMEQVFEMKVKEKKQKLKDSEADLQKRSEQMKKSLEQQQQELDEKWKSFDKEKQMWEESTGYSNSLENVKDAHKKTKKGLF
ncbi:septin-7-like isoform X2 [Mya arenaria]|uniref:septin-7-like isoform X2 n=1 Tax=Mya arenaria TaxID=6604 RepID=UPI0022E082F2|nr:septin-7-like isoform X2 [Mya arenaria]